jgi:hypothetical protein
VQKSVCNATKKTNKTKHYSLLFVAGVDENDIPVFLFDLVDDNYLLDKTEQAVSFPDMVVAVQTQNNYIYTDFGCDGDTVILDASDATRAVLAALIQTIWGVSPTFVFCFFCFFLFLLLISLCDADI